MKDLKTVSLMMPAATHRGLKSVAALHGLRIGHALGGLMLLAKSVPAVQLAACMASADPRQGELVPHGESTEEHAHRARAEHLADIEDD